MQQSQLDQLRPGLFIWQAYDPKVKADLFSTGLQTPVGIYLVDPIPLEESALLGLRTHGKVAGIFITNGNHLRSAIEFANTFSVSIYVHHSLRGNPDFPETTWVYDGQMFSGGITLIAIEGGPAGEMALHYSNDDGTVVIGDALINFEPHGFTFLPEKYCQDANRMRTSLRKLLDYSFERILFAHGMPILSNGRARMAELLETSQ